MRKVFVLFCILLCVGTIRIRHLEQPPIRLRKSVNVLNETERKSLFWSIKMMAVLPAPDRFQNWTYRAFINLPKGNATVRPLRVADILVSSHSSSCEHANFYFAHYHRHLMVHSEIWLNFVHQTLRGGKQRLLELYPAELYQSDPQEWDAVFQEYSSSGAADLPFISLHYWNPTNYNNKEDLLVPKELARHHENRNKIVDVVDKLFFAVLGYWPWEANARTRLTSPNLSWNQTEFQGQMEISQAFDFIGQAEPLTIDEDNIEKFKMTPRMQPEGQDYDDYIKSYAHFQNTQARYSPFISHTRKRFRDYFHGIGNNITIPMSAVSENEIYILEGAKVEYRYPGNQSNIIRVQNQYISKEERRGLDLASGPTSDYNTLLPHYVMAYAFYNDQAIPTFKDFLEGEEGIARPHNYMHGYHGFFLRDALYSITTLFFYPFHSWIDAMLEIKIRLSNFEDSFNTGKSHYNTTKDYLDSKKTNQAYRFTMLLNDETDPEYVERVAALINAETQNFQQMIAANNQSVFPELPGKDTVGSHMVIEWTNHFMNTTLIENKTVEKPFLPAFSMRDYILTQKRLRSSKDLGGLYRDVYVENNKQRFDGLIDITNFPFDYDYQVYDGKGKPTPTLDDSASNVARYIRGMFDDVQSSYKNFIPPMRAALKTVLSGDESSNKPNETYYRSILFNTSFIHVKYQSGIPHNHYPITLSLQETDSLPRVQALLASWNISDAVIDDLNNGVKVESLSSRKCEKQCNVTKQILLELDTDLLETNRTVWNALRVLLLGDNQILKDSRQPSYLDSLSSTLKLKSTEESKEIQVNFLKGAQRIKLQTQLSEVPQEKRAILKKGIRVTAKAGAVGADSGVDEVTVRMQAQNPKDARFSFEPIVPSSQPKVTNHIGSLLYKHIQIEWNNGVVLEFDIPFYSKTANYRLLVGLDESSQPYFCLEDADFAIKHEFLVQALATTD